MSGVGDAGCLFGKEGGERRERGGGDRPSLAVERSDRDEARQEGLQPRAGEQRQVRAFVKAWNTKIIPIFLTVVSTILGFIPFMVGTGKEGFWFPLAAGTIGGLVMSIVGIFVFLPIFTLKKRK